MVQVKSDRAAVSPGLSKTQFDQDANDAEVQNRYKRNTVARLGVRYSRSEKNDLCHSCISLRDVEDS